MTKLLMIDDNPIEHTIAKALFKHYGFFEGSHHIFDGKAAIEYVEKILHTGVELPDIILLDLNMPKFNGWDFLEHFQKLSTAFTKQINLYILSSSVCPKDHELPILYPFIKSFLVKPLSLKILEQINQQSAGPD
jgi:CheY-like chemotaxis protein